MVAATLQAGGCSSDHGNPPRLSYTLKWDFEGVERVADSGGWRVTTNKGYEITVEAGYLVAYSIAFLPCDIAGRRRQATSSNHPAKGSSRLSYLGPRNAHAGHGDTFFNPVQTEVPIVESLMSGETVDAGSFVPEPVRYCQVHYVLARAPTDSIGLPSDVDMVGATAHVEGYYRRGPDGPKTAFTIHSPSANAVLENILEKGPAPGDEEPGFDGTSTRAAAIILRRAAGLFDDIDFENDSRHKIPWQFLKNAADATTVRIELVGGGDGVGQ